MDKGEVRAGRFNEVMETEIWVVRACNGRLRDALKNYKRRQ